MGSIGFVELDDLALDQINGGCDKKKTCSGSTSTGGAGWSDDLLGPGYAGNGGSSSTTKCCKKTCERERERECERR